MKLSDVHVAAAESLRDFAFANIDVLPAEVGMAFVYMCTSALAGKEWAMRRVLLVVHRIAKSSDSGFGEDTDTLAIIRDTNTTRSDGTIARGFEV